VPALPDQSFKTLHRNLVRRSSLHPERTPSAGSASACGGGKSLYGCRTIFGHIEAMPVPNPYDLALRQADQARTDFANIEITLEFLMPTAFRCRRASGSCAGSSINLARSRHHRNWRGGSVAMPPPPPARRPTPAGATHEEPRGAYRGYGGSTPASAADRRTLILLTFLEPPQTAAEPPRRTAAQAKSMTYDNRRKPPQPPHVP
jgi:hypothetical protein